jgi:predicted RNase H-like nuclease (RuvC/YqgF family)
MNAYELADELKIIIDEANVSPYTVPLFRQQASRIEYTLRQQADRIAELEKTNQEMSDLYEKEIDKRADRIAELEKCLIVEQEHNMMLEEQLAIK